MRFSGKTRLPRGIESGSQASRSGAALDPGVHTKCFCRHPISRAWGFLPLPMLILIVLSATALAAQAKPTGQLPEAIRGAKIYQLPTKGGKPAPNPGIYKKPLIPGYQLRPSAARSHLSVFGLWIAPPLWNTFIFRMSGSTAFLSTLRHSTRSSSFPIRTRGCSCAP